MFRKRVVLAALIALFALPLTGCLTRRSYCPTSAYAPPVVVAPPPPPACP